MIYNDQKLKAKQYLLISKILSIQDFRNLKIWQRAHELVLLTYRITANFPKDEIFGLRHSMRKTAVDVAAFIAEGSSKGDDIDFARSVGAAIAIASKLEYYALVAADLEFVNPEIHENYEKEIVEIKKMMQGFRRRLISAN